MSEHKRTIRATPKPSLPLPAALAGLINRGSFHGSWLPLQTASADNVALAERAIKCASLAGLIERGDYDPSRDQLFFGLGGFPGDKLKRLDEEHRSPLAYHWITKTLKWLDPTDVEALL